MGGTVPLDRRRTMMIGLSSAALLGIILLSVKSDLLSSTAQWIFADSGNCDFDPNDYEAGREKVLDIDEDIEVLKERLARTGYAPERARILRDIATLVSEKTILINKFGHCSGWGNH